MSARISSNTSGAIVFSTRPGVQPRERLGFGLHGRADVLRRLAERLLEQREQQLVLAVEVLVEPAQRLLRAVDHLLDGELGRALLVDQLERGVQQALDALLGAGARGVEAARYRPLAPAGFVVLHHVVGSRHARILVQGGADPWT